MPREDPLSGKSGYWQRPVSPRLTRRRFALVAAGAGIAVASAACGDGAAPAPVAVAPARPTGPLSSPEDATSVAKPGGVLRSFATADVSSFDPHSAVSTAVHSQIAALTYPRLLKFVSGRFPERAKGDVEGDLAESFELTPDRMQITLRLRQGLRWDARAPVNGRAIEASDVLASWNRFLRLSPYRPDLAYEANLAPGAPIDSLATPDARTAVIKLKQPDVSVLSLLASERLFYVLPREADAGFDPRFETRGYGPYRMAENRPGSFRSWTRNPDYYVRGRPFIETIEQPIIGDYASRLAQFKAGNIWTSVAGQGEMLAVKHEVPQLLLRRADNFPTSPSSLAFGYEGDSPWKDERLRQAVSMLIDRDTLVHLFSNKGLFEANGVAFDIRLHTAVGAGWDGFWVDPRYEGTFGPSHRYFRFDPIEAKRLLAAAGYADGLDSSFHYSAGNQYGGGYARLVEMISGMLAEGGIRLTLERHEFQTDWMPNFHNAYAGVQNPGRPTRGFNGLAYRVAMQYPSPESQLFGQMHKDGVRFEGMTPDGKNANLGDPEINNALTVMRREFDLKRRQELAGDFARLMAKKSYIIPNMPFASLGYTLTWPAIANFGVYRPWPAGSAPTEANLHTWIDPSRAPLTLF